MIAMSASGASSIESRRGWFVVISAMVGAAVGLSPIPFYTIGMFAPELSEAFGWSFAAMMGSIGVQSAAVMLVSPLAGLTVDRFGARPVALISLFLFGLCFMSLALSNGSLTLYYAQWAIMSVLGAGTLSATWTRVVNGWFDRNRGLALGLASTGTGITGFLIKPFSAWLIEDYGWRHAFVAVGALPIIIGIPVVLWLFRENRATQVANDGAEQLVITPAEGDDSPAAPEAGLTLKEALRGRHFWILAISFFLIAFALTAPTPNLENILKTLGFSLSEVGAIAASFGLAVIAGRIVGGWLLDRFYAPACAVAVLVIPAFGCWLLSGTQLSGDMATVAVLALGFGAGFEFDLLAFLIAKYFGQRSYGVIYGCFYTVIALGGGLGPVVYGYMFDSLGSYSHALTMGSISVMIGAMCLLLLGKYPKLSS
jgi:MFS family permease